jgi:hypothetical protein
MAKEKRSAAELAALVRSHLKDPSGCTVAVLPHVSGWKAQATCRLDNETAVRSEVHQIATRLQMFYDLEP